MLDEVCAFIARYLQCSESQRTVLALWVLHTWCFAAARSTPYLAIQSSRKLSGKTLCLRLLNLLCPNPALTSGYTPSVLVNRIHTHPNDLPTFLLDVSSATLGSRSRSKNPKLRAILISGFQPSIGYSDRSLECTIYSPKAFASIGPPPEDLADCSVPIILQPLRDPARSSTERFDSAIALEEARPLVAALENWSRNLSALKSARPYKRQQFPESLTTRGQDLVEPLLQIADAVGGDYPQRARQALISVFDDVGKEEREISIQLLRDIRQLFQHHSWPDGLPTAVVLDELRSLPSRPWDIDGPITKHTLAKILRPYKICPRMLRSKLSKGKSSGARGYLQEHFVTVWNDLLDNPQARVAPAPSPAGEETKATVRSDAAGLRAASAAAEPKKSDSERKLAGGWERSDKTNGHAGCCDVAEPRIDPRIKGILDDPRNFYRQYPEQHQNNLRALIASPYHWPQPADDKMPPDVIYTLRDGTKIPFTVVNRPPRKPPLCFPDFQTKRWPVTLDDQEKLQVAVARFYELYEQAHATEEDRVAQSLPAVS